VGICCHKPTVNSTVKEPSIACIYTYLLLVIEFVDRREIFRLCISIYNYEELVCVNSFPIVVPTRADADREKIAILLPLLDTVLSEFQIRLFEARHSELNPCPFLV